MFGMMKGNRIEVENDHEIALDSILAKGIRRTPDIHALATASDASMVLMVWNYHDADVPQEKIDVLLNIKNIPAKKVMLSQFRIDRDHSNAYEVWKSMGSPQAVNDTQFKILERAGQLELFKSPEWLVTNKGQVYMRVTLPAQAVSLIKLEYK
jgi:xylan 1,4-beta-xylosidase